MLATKRADGSRAVLAWNHVPPQQTRGMGFFAMDELVQAEAEMKGQPRSLTLKFNGGGDIARARITVIDMLRGSALPAWEAMENRNTRPRTRLRNFRRPRRCRPSTNGRCAMANSRSNFHRRRLRS